MKKKFRSVLVLGGPLSPRGTGPAGVGLGCRLPPTAVRMNLEPLRLSCYIVDDDSRPNMAYTEYSLIILSHIVLAKFAITSREIF
jgi:hypothetical protein